MKNQNLRVDVKKFLSSKNIAFYGLSRNEKEFSHSVYQALAQAGFNLYPIHDQVSVIGEHQCYPALSMITDNIDAVFVMVSPQKVAAILDQAAEKKITSVWIQKGADSPQISSLAKEKIDACVIGECIFMHLEPVRHIHRLHRGISKIMGNFPG